MINATIGYTHGKNGIKPISLPFTDFYRTPNEFKSQVDWVREQLAKIPTTALRKRAALNYVKRHMSETAKRPERSANIYLREVAKRVTEITSNLALTFKELNSAKKRKAKAKQYALMCNQMQIVHFDENTTLSDVNNMLVETYYKLNDFVSGQGFKMPYLSAINKLADGRNYDAAANYIECAIKRVTCHKWWQRRLQRERDLTLEWLNVSMGMVRKGVSAYASTDCINEFRNNKKSQEKWLESMQLVNESGDKEIDLKDVFKGSVANPEIRRIELMVRIRGYADHAKQQGLTAMFYTITAPSKYHATSKKYNNATPKQTQAFLVSQWAKVRATLAKVDIKLFGLRVCEPHHDATPHWHMLLFMKPEHKDAITKVMRHFAMQVDGDEAGAAKNRFDAEEIDPKKGDAVGYIAKYVSKNINTNHLDGEKDHETGENFEADNGMATGVSAWASRWRIRQFQFVGGAPVGVWRELRRIKPNQFGELCFSAKKLYVTVNKSRFAKFIELLKRIPVEVIKSTKINEYGEAIKKTESIAVSVREIITRGERWGLQKKGATATPWSTGNNCNHVIKQPLKHGEKQNPLNEFIPNELQSAFMQGATVREFDESRRTITDYKLTNGQFAQQSIRY